MPASRLIPTGIAKIAEIGRGGHQRRRGVVTRHVASDEKLHVLDRSRPRERHLVRTDPGYEILIGNPRAWRHDREARDLREVAIVQEQLADTGNNLLVIGKRARGRLRAAPGGIFDAARLRRRPGTLEPDAIKLGGHARVITCASCMPRRRNRRGRRSRFVSGVPMRYIAPLDIAVHRAGPISSRNADALKSGQLDLR